MEKATFKGQLVASSKDIGGYITYVFELLDDADKIRLNTTYIMTVRYPNWNQDEFDLYDIGFVQVLEVMAGVDKYFDGSNMIPYKYNNIQFIKFIKEKPIVDNIIKID